MKPLQCGLFDSSSGPDIPIYPLPISSLPDIRALTANHSTCIISFNSHNSFWKQYVLCSPHLTNEQTEAPMLNALPKVTQL